MAGLGSLKQMSRKRPTRSPSGARRAKRASNVRSWQLAQADELARHSERLSKVEQDLRIQMMRIAQIQQQLDRLAALVPDDGDRTRSRGSDRST
jgi:hypothetical protein